MNTYSFYFRSTPPHPDTLKVITVKGASASSASTHETVKQHMSRIDQRCVGVVQFNGREFSIFKPLTRTERTTDES